MEVKLTQSTIAAFVLMLWTFHSDFLKERRHFSSS